MELPDDFSASSKKRAHSDDEERMKIDGTSLLTSKTIDFLNDKQAREHETNKAAVLIIATMESAKE